MKENVPDARMNPVAPASRPVPPTMVCRSTIDPSAVLVNTPAFFTSRVPRYRLTAPVIVEFEVKALTVVIGVSARRDQGGRAARERPDNVTAVIAGNAQAHRGEAVGPADRMFDIATGNGNASGGGRRLTGGQCQCGHHRRTRDEHGPSLAGREHVALLDVRDRPRSAAASRSDRCSPLPDRFVTSGLA